MNFQDRPLLCLVRLFFIISEEWHSIGSALRALPNQTINFKDNREELKALESRDKMSPEWYPIVLDGSYSLLPFAD